MAKKKRAKKTNKAESLHIIHPAAAGIDIGASEIYVAVSDDRSDNPVRCFDTFTEDLQRPHNG
ncbi:MAG: hypothetical protein D3907_02270 [Candidatus Electrothrix sp. AUS3]|nr:hypothetical protein [Candidatus Electrothrix gigas]